MMLPLPVISTALLPNGTITELDFHEMESWNWISPDIVEALSKTGEIVRDGDQVFVEFQRRIGRVLYFDGAWCQIGTLVGPCILLGKP